MTTTHTTETGRRAYDAQLRRELAVLPRRSQRGLLQDAAEHAAGAGDEEGFVESFGDPAVIARTAIEEHDLDARRPLRPSLLLQSKLLQLVAAVVASPFVAIALIAVLVDGSVFGLPSVALWALVTLPPLLARWTAWWRTSVVCTILHACFLAVGLVILVGGMPVPMAGVVFLMSGPLLGAHCLSLALSVLALLRAPRVLCTR
ncbi:MULTISPECIES: hypothetical protein [unclassified Rathayibacter]|uniref:hypothetical protein n=1 Tax=unclassified Rathayibacter TaxID=2609250 RepID=UPI000F4C48E3|nr:MULTISPECIES: hypothetical protein [unclassified Rathayibacter]ROP57468.1 putative membrane protein [Rathayibacter sp. PhB186]ROS55853.1 putative membrane protein [Rathayibacter sp. PhB185]